MVLNASFLQAGNIETTEFAAAAQVLCNVNPQNIGNKLKSVCKQTSEFLEDMV